MVDLKVDRQGLYKRVDLSPLTVLEGLPSGIREIERHWRK